MPSEKISWSLTAGSPGGSIGDSGALEVDAVTVANVSVDPESTRTLSLQLDDVENIMLLALKASHYDGTIKLATTGTGASEVTMTGPLVLYGDAVKLFGESLATMNVINDNTEPIEVEALLGLVLTTTP